MHCSQSYGSCNLPSTDDSTAGNHFLLGALPIPLSKICWHVGQVGEKENHSKAGKHQSNLKQPLSLFYQSKRLIYVDIIYVS